jgi:lysozyme family protein
MEIIRLGKGAWSFDPNRRLGKPGGFGEVFLGAGEDGPVAVKRLHVTAEHAAHRELAIAQSLQSRQLRFVVPILDAGLDAESDRYFLVMPLCEKTLSEHIANPNVALDTAHALAVARSIVAGLLEVGDIVHRDLKPSNILLHDGTWKIADFGIAKFVEDSTSARTVQNALTPAYAAPEQWRLERATHATDVYALGCIFHTLVNGRPPFEGSQDQLRQAHLAAAPPALSNIAPRLETFLSQMLRKPAASRPTLERCQVIFSEAHVETKSLSPAGNALAEATRVVEERAAREEANRMRIEQDARRRTELFNDAASYAAALVGRVQREIAGHYDKAAIDRDGWLTFGQSGFGFIQHPVKAERTKAPSVRSPFHALTWDIVAWAIIAVKTSGDSKASPYTWSATLYYADMNNGSGYRWYEVAFLTSFRSSRQGDRDEPYAIGVDGQDFHAALSPMMHSAIVAYGPEAIDGEDEQSFVDRWIGLIAEAAVGNLKRPTSFPYNGFA